MKVRLIVAAAVATLMLSAAPANAEGGDDLKDKAAACVGSALGALPGSSWYLVTCMAD